MKNYNLFTLIALAAAFTLQSCGGGTEKPAELAADSTALEATDDFEYFAEQFADLKLIRYKIAGWDKLSPKQKELIYYLYEAGVSGRDMIWDQNYRHNLEIRKALETILSTFSGDKTTDDWTNFETYAKRVFFANGIHHHYSMSKLPVDFSYDYLDNLLEETGATLSDEAKKAILDPDFDAKKVNLDPEKGLLKGSAVNLYAPDVTESEVDAYYESIVDTNTNTPISYGLNSRMEKDAEGNLMENVYKSGGLYGAAIDKVVN